MFFSYRACSDEHSYDAFPIELSRWIVILAVLAEKETSTEPLPCIFLKSLWLLTQPLLQQRRHDQPDDSSLLSESILSTLSSRFR
nr:hypothetical protein [Evansella caseinilytica]